MTVTIITGAPASGKTTFVEKHAKPGDIRIDFDSFTRTISGIDSHTQSREVIALALEMWKASVATALRLRTTKNIWIIHADPDPIAFRRYQRAGTRIIQIDPGEEIVLSRCQSERPPEAIEKAKQWYAKWKPKKAK